LDRVVEILLACRLLLHERRIALHVEFCAALHRLCVGQHCFRLSQLPLGLIERCLKRTRINLKQELALFNESALLISLLQQVSRNLCPDVSIDQPIEGSNEFPVNRHIFLLNLQHLDSRQSDWLRSQGVFVGMNRSNDQSQYEQEGKSHAQKVTFG